MNCLNNRYSAQKIGGQRGFVLVELLIFLAVALIVVEIVVGQTGRGCIKVNIFTQPAETYPMAVAKNIIIINTPVNEEIVGSIGRSIEHVLIGDDCLRGFSWFSVCRHVGRQVSVELVWEEIADYESLYRMEARQIFKFNFFSNLDHFNTGKTISVSRRCLPSVTEMELGHHWFSFADFKVSIVTLTQAR